MKDEQVLKLNSFAVHNTRRRILYLVPLFFAAMSIGFLLQLYTYQLLSSEIKLAIANLPQLRSYKPPSNQASGDELLQKQHEIGNLVIKDAQVDVQRNDSNDTLVGEGAPVWKKPTLLNLQPFSWLMNNESLCKLDNPSNKRLLAVLVHTARVYFAERLSIRELWRSIPIYKKWDVRLVFLLGQADRGSKPDDNQQQFEEEEKRLAVEQERFGDIVVGTFIDSYHNLTYKHMMGYKWILNFCQNATFVLKVDDDIFVDIMQWLDWRTRDVETMEQNSTAKVPDLYCNTFARAKPFRTNSSKWYVSKEDWPDEYYPDYCSGWAYGITVDLIKTLYSVTNDIKFFWIDDVFVTGALMEAAKKKYDFKPNIVHIWGNVTSDTNEYRPLCDKGAYDEKRRFRAVAYVPRGDLFERDMMCMWNKTLHDRKYNLTHQLEKFRRS